MTKQTTVPKTLSVHVPFCISKRGGRKEVQLPPGAPAQRSRIDNTLVKALARAHRWKRLLDAGQYSSTAELAAAEKINESYVCRILRLTLLAPEIVEPILDGRQPTDLKMDTLLKPFPVDWGKQIVHFR